MEDRITWPWKIVLTGRKKYGTVKKVTKVEKGIKKKDRVVKTNCRNWFEMENLKECAVCRRRNRVARGQQLTDPVRTPSRTSVHHPPTWWRVAHLTFNFTQEQFFLLLILYWEWEEDVCPEICQNSYGFVGLPVEYKRTEVFTWKGMMTIGSGRSTPITSCSGLFRIDQNNPLPSSLSGNSVLMSAWEWVFFKKNLFFSSQNSEDPHNCEDIELRVLLSMKSGMSYSKCSCVVNSQSHFVPLTIPDAKFSGRLV
jgi:hypothetical protein